MPVGKCGIMRVLFFQGGRNYSILYADRNESSEKSMTQGEKLLSQLFLRSVAMGLK